MKKIIYILILFYFAGSIRANNAENSPKILIGRITNSNNEGIAGATVYFPELKTGAATDSLGNYQIDNLPHRTMLVQIQAMGYRMIAEQLDLKTVERKNYCMKEAIIEMNEVVVTGQAGASQMIKMPTPISIVSSADLQQQASTNIIDAISSQPGVSQISTGVGISKPVIRGLGYNRVVVMNDGVRQEGQQWGDEHGIEVDEFDVNRVEILKGPASLMYGSDAMAGVINLLSSPILPAGTMKLNVLTNYQTNNGLMGYSINFVGHKKSLVWDIRYSHKKAHAYQNKYDGYVYNSGFSENALSGLVGINKWWGYSHLTLSTYQLTPGIVEGDRDDVTGKFIKPVVSPDGSENEVEATHSDFMSYNRSMPYQQVKHYKAVWNSTVLLGDGSLKTTLGYQQNRRQEFEDIAHPDVYALYFKLHTLNYTVQYNLPEQNGLGISAGMNGMYQKSLNKGEEFLIPEYRLFDAGVFVVAKKSLDKFDISGGFRFDNRSETADALYLNANEEKTISSDASATERFRSFSSQFRGVSASLGASYQVSERWNTKLNFSRGFRAPNISELSANGVHEGTIRYEMGNPDLKAESSLQVDYELAYNTEHVSAKLNLFANNIANYIFSHKLNSVLGGDSISDGNSCYQFHSGDARILGGEFSIDIHPHPWDWLHIENDFSYVNAQLKNQTDSTRHLPLTPSAKWRSVLKVEVPTVSRNLRNTFASVGIEYNFKQKDVYSAYSTETPTPAYTLVNACVGTDLILRKRKCCSLFISGSNLLDIAYQSHLSRLKYAAVNNITGRTGVYNMGRNISIKLIVPVDL